MKCSCCNKEISRDELTFFHSKCCSAHFEGVVLHNGEMIIVCEKCGKFCGKVGK